MKHWIVSIIINLLSATVRCQQEQHHEMNLMNRLNDFYGFDHNIFFLDSSTDHNRYISAKDDNFRPKTIYVFDHNLDNINGTQMTTVESATSKNIFLIVVVESLKFHNNSQLLVQMEEIRWHKASVKIGVFFAKNVISMDIIEQFFRWSWNAGIVNIFVAFYTNTEDVASSFNVFRFDPFGPFGTFDLINVTGSVALQNYFHDKMPNYRHHSLRLLVLIGSPVFIQDVNFWDTVAKVFNASMALINLDFENMTAETRPTDIWMTELVVTSDTEIYPHRTNTLVLLVPHARPFSNILPYLQNATWKLIFGYTVIMIAALSFVLTVSGYLQTKKILLFQCVGVVIKLLMNDNGSIRYGRLHLADVFVIVPLTFTGLIVTNGILSVFQSFLTLPIYERQINTIDDLFKSPVPIISFFEINNLLELESKHGGWSDKLHETEYSQLWKEVTTFNNSVAYALYNNGVPAILDVQKRLKLKAYHLITETYLQRLMSAYAPRRNFPFIKPIDDTMHRLLSAGLMAKWFKDDDELSVKEMIKTNLNLQFKISYESEFAVPIVVWCGWIASIIIFSCEIIRKKVEPQIEKLKNKLSIPPIHLVKCLDRLGLMLIKCGQKRVKVLGQMPKTIAKMRANAKQMWANTVGYKC